MEIQVKEESKLIKFLSDVIDNMPTDWLKLTTHRLDIYNERLAKVEFLEKFETLYKDGNSSANTLKELPTAYDYIRLGHPLSCLLEWYVANEYNVNAEAVISFSSKTTPAMAVLRKNLLENKDTLIAYTDLPNCFDADKLKSVYGYKFELLEVESVDQVPSFDGSVIFFSKPKNLVSFALNSNIDFAINIHDFYGSILLAQEASYVSEIQHVRRRETIAMTPASTLEVLKSIVNDNLSEVQFNTALDRMSVVRSINAITGADTKAVVASSGLSMQYAIMMGLVDEAQQKHPGKPIRFIVPPNCYGGTNDQARRVAACAENIQIMDLPVDGGNDMVQSIDTVLDAIAAEDAVSYIIAEIPTNPRVEVPDLEKLRDVLVKERKTSNGAKAIAPVFILDQTFCPNTSFLRENDVLNSTKTLSYVSGSKFPSGGLCTAGYCTANKNAESLMDAIELHLRICDNEATALQYEILSNQLPSMNARIASAYMNTREFVSYIEEVLPEAKINFVSEELAAQGFTPSVFSLDLPTKGATEEAKEMYKRELNHKLIGMMINEIPNESKYCVSYGQLKGCYWTIPATSTQGTTKEGDKDYIARVALSGNMDLEKHKAVFKAFVDSL